MKHFLMRTTAFYAPETGGGGGGGGGSDDGALAGEALKGTPFEGVEGAKVPASFVKEGKIDFAGMLGAASRPDPFDGVEVPDKFKKDGKIDVPNFVKAHKELEQSQFRRRDEVTAEVRKTIDDEAIKAAPAAPGDYKPPADWTVGEGDTARNFKIDEKDPMFTYFAGLAHQLRVPQATFEGAMKGYVEAAAASLPDWNVEMKALGPHAEKRLERVDGFLKGNLNTENYNHFASMPATSRGVAAIEELMTLAGHPPIVGDTQDVGDDTYTESKLREMMRDPKYTGERGGRIDPAFVAKVRAGWQRLSKKK